MRSSVPRMESERRFMTLPQIASAAERGVYAASSFPSRQSNRFVHAVRSLKRPEGRAPGAVCGRTQSE